jgi:hypothetical protein
MLSISPTPPPSGARRARCSPQICEEFRRDRSRQLIDDGKGSVGSLMVLKAPDRASAEAFNRADPFHKNDVWANVEIQRFDRKE